MSNANELQKIRELVSEALAAATVNRAHIDGAINWGELYCSSVQQIEDHDGDCWRRVVVEEASPTASSLKAFIKSFLYEHGVREWVEVVTEW